jgi:HAMP domain-containing protein
MVMIALRTQTILGEQMIARGRAIAVSIAQNSSELILEDSDVELRNLAMESKSFESVNYVLIEDEEHNIIADTFNGNVPKELRGLVVINEEDAASGIPRDTVLSVSGVGGVYEITTPIDNGEFGFVRVGMDKNYVDNIIDNTIRYIMIFLGIAVLFAIFASFMLANYITKPIIYLTDLANKISLGEFDTVIKVKSNDEIGDLGISIERMRESLKAAIDRLRKRQKMRV